MQLEKLTKQLVTIAGLALVASVALNMARGQSFTEVFTVAVAFAIAAIPTGLPGGRHDDPLARHAAARRGQRDRQAAALDRDARRDVGDLLGQDRHADAQPDDRGRADDPRPPLHGLGQRLLDRGQIKHVAGEPEVPLEQFMLPLALACDAVVTDAGEMIGDPTEGALVVLAEKGGLDLDADARALPARRRAAVRHRLQADGDVPPDDRRVGQRGRPLLRQGRARPAARARRRRTSTRRWRPRRSTTSFKARYLAENERLAEQGLRVMATARKDFDAARLRPAAPTCSTLMDDLTLLALVGIVDPPRPAAKAAIATAHDAGIQVRMITGDHAITAEAIARELGIEGRAISGAQFAEMSDDAGRRARSTRSA